jgi:hypothetical protein
MVNWNYSQQITGKIEYPGLWESSRILIRVASLLTPVWRKAGYLKIESLIDGEYFTVDYKAIEFGNSLIEISLPAYRLSFEPVSNLTAIYPNTSISIYQLSPSEVRNLHMSGSYDPGNRPVGADSSATVAAAVTNTVIAAANALRSPEGYIVNNSNKNLWVTFTGVAATAAPPATKVLPNGGNYDIPGGYTGAINGIWEAAATGSCVVHEFSFI